MFGVGSFYEAEAQSHADIQEEFGTRWRYVPMRRPPNMSSQPDPTRQPYDIVGIFQQPSKHFMLAAEEGGYELRDPKMTVMRCNLQYPPRQYDVFEFVCGGNDDIKPGDMFEITDIRPDGVSGVAFDLNMLGVPNGGAP